MSKRGLPTFLFQAFQGIFSPAEGHIGNIGVGVVLEVGKSSIGLEVGLDQLFSVSSIQSFDK